MTEIQTFDKHINEWYSRWFPLSEKYLGRAIDPREGGFHRFTYREEGDEQDLYASYEPLALEDMTFAVESLRELQKEHDEIDENSIKDIFAQRETLKNIYHSHWKGRLKAYVEWPKRRFNRDLTKEEMNTAIVGSVLDDVLEFGDNYSIWIFGKDELTFDKLAESCKRIFIPSDNYKVVSPKQCKPYEGKNGRLMGISKPGCDLGDFNGHGTGSIVNLDEWPQNKILARWHGQGIGTADFALKMAEAIKENSYSAHFNFLVCDPMSGVRGTFYDPNWEI